MSTLRKARLQSRRVAQTGHAGVQEFDVGDFIRGSGGALGATVYPPEQKPQGHCWHNCSRRSAIVKKTGVYAD